MATFSDHFTLLGFEEARGELENAHRRATLKAGMTERRNDGIAESRNGGKLPQILKHGIVESRNGGKYPQILKDGIAESRNGGKYPQILKDGMTENHPNS